MRPKEFYELLGITKEQLKEMKKKDIFIPEIGIVNGHTEFTENDVINLKRILVLSKAGITQSDIKKLQDGEISLPEAILHRNKINLDNIRKRQAAIELSNRYLDLGYEYDNIPVENAWDYIQNQEGNGIAYPDFEYEEFKIDKSRDIRCPKCKATIHVDLEEYEYDQSSDEGGMGYDTVYYFDSEDSLECDKCNSMLHLHGWLREYPIGAYDSEDIKIDIE